MLNHIFLPMNDHIEKNQLENIQWQVELNHACLRLLEYEVSDVWDSLVSVEVKVVLVEQPAQENEALFGVEYPVNSQSTDLGRDCLVIFVHVLVVSLIFHFLIEEVSVKNQTRRSYWSNGLFAKMLIGIECHKWSFLHLISTDS